MPVGVPIPVGMAIYVAVAVRVRFLDVLDAQLLGSKFHRSNLLCDNRGLGGGRHLLSLADADTGYCRVSSGFGSFRAQTGDDRLPLGIDEGHSDLCHAERLAIPRPGKDHVLHASAAQALGRLFAEHPSDGVAQVRLAAAVRADHRRQAAARKTHLGAVAKRLKPLDFNAL